ncbi:MAG: four helix bundle suffix domain-containing protein [Prosthecobacter sp.]|nr:four helix bundle suffix domain-containing protein [Prosthecobacter sp.]
MGSACTTGCGRVGGYRELRSFQVTTIIYDGTVMFCDRFVDKRSRTHDQMVQAARSGRQNIAEGNRAGATSSKTEMHLTNVARGSLDELLLDYEDYLRQRRLPQWGKEDAEALAVRRVGAKADPTDRSDRSDLTDATEVGDRARWAVYAPWLEHESAAVRANALICLIHQANYLLDQQLVALERDFIREGGYSEQLAAARIGERGRGDRTDSQFPECPVCGKLMSLRTARQGQNAGSQFWKCTGYPACKGTRKVE